MNVIMRDRQRLPKRVRIKIEVDQTRVGRVRVWESQVFNGLVINAEQATLTRFEALTLAEWLHAWATSSERDEEA
jgi:hypothetical protein